MAQITLLDGSIGQELVKRSGAAPTPLWSTRVMMETPDLVGAVHDDYFAAGATVASTNSYSVHRTRLAREGREDQLVPLIEAAVAQAATARDRRGAGRVAGTLGPLMASFRPDLSPDVALARTRYDEVIRAMGGAVDLLLAETVCSLQEAEGIFAGYAASGSTAPLWMSFSVDDVDGTRLRSGEALAQAGALVAQHQPAAVLLNCALPETIAQGLPVLGGFGLPFGAYANGFTKITDDFKQDAPTVAALQARGDLGPEAYAVHVMGWVEAGATIVGGCCEAGPDHIAHIAKCLNDAGHTII